MANNSMEIEHAEMDSGSIIALAAAGTAIIVAFITGAWQWLSGRKKNETDAQSTIIDNFVALLAEFKNERVALVSRINDLEKNNYLQDRHIAKLERLMIRHNIEIPDEEERK